MVVALYEDEDYSKMMKASRKRKEMEEELKNIQKEFFKRNPKVRKDKRSSHWYIDYVLDEQGLYDNPDNRDGLVFRFSYWLPLLISLK